MRHRSHTRHYRTRGSILIVTMVVLLVMAGVAIVLARAARVEALTAVNYDAQLRAEAIAQGAIQAVAAAVNQSEGQLPADGEINAEAVRLGDGYFWILKHQTSDDTRQTFGLTDETGKLNVNTATLDMLAALPGMNNDLAAGVIDWRDPDDEPQAGGAESQYYLLRTPAYNAKNGPFETIDELLLVKDITPAILLGEDGNRNTLLDANEDDADTAPPSDNRNGRLDRGIIDLVTVYGAEPNTTASGQQRVNVNNAPPDRINALLAAAATGARLNTLSTSAPRNRPYNSALDFYAKNQLTIDEFSKIADQIGVNNAPMRGGLVNVNSAPLEVLRCLPGLDESDAQAILSRRSRNNTPMSLADLAEVLPREKVGAIGPFVTTRSYFCSADIVAVDGHGRAFKRLLAVFDTRSSPPAVVYCRDLTALGWPLGQAILDNLRAGLGPTNATEGTR